MAQSHNNPIPDTSSGKPAFNLELQNYKGFALVLLLFFGCWLFMLLAGYFSIPLAFSIKAVVGGACAILIFGCTLFINKKHTFFSLILQTLSLGMLYLLFRCLAPEFLSISQTLMCMGLVVLPVVALSLKYDSQLLALIGFTAFVFAPLLLPVKITDLYMVFWLQLGAGLLLIVIQYFKAWNTLNIFSLIFLFSVFAALFRRRYPSDWWALSEWWLFALLMFYIVLVLIRSRKPDFNPRNFSDFLLVAILPFIAAIFQWRIGSSLPEALFWACAFTGVICCLLGLFGFIGFFKRFPVLAETYLIIGLVSLNLGLPTLLEGWLVTLLLTLEGVCFFGLGCGLSKGRLKVYGEVLLFFAPVFYLFGGWSNNLYVLFVISVSGFICCYLHNREFKKLHKRAGRVPWASRQELVLFIWGAGWWLVGLGVICFTYMPEPGITFFAACSASAYFWYAVGRFIRLRSIRMLVFIPFFIAVPALLLPFTYQIYQYWPEWERFFAYNFFTGSSLLAWFAFFVTSFTLLYRGWGGLISSRQHTFILSLVIIMAVVLLSSVGRSVGYELKLAASIVNTLGVLPILLCILLMSLLLKFHKIPRSYRHVLVFIVPLGLFMLIFIWFGFSLTSLGSAAPGGGYMPILNPVEFTQIACVFTFSFWQRRLRKVSPQLPHLSEKGMLWFYDIVLFTWLHGLAFRVVQFFSQAAVEDVLNFPELQIAWICLWLVFGLVHWRIGARENYPACWNVGIVQFITGTLILILLIYRINGILVAAGCAAVVTICSYILLRYLPFPTPEQA